MDVERDFLSVELDQVHNWDDLQHLFWKLGQFGFSECAQRLIDREELSDDHEALADSYRATLADVNDMIHELRGKYKRVPIEYLERIQGTIREVL